MCTSVPGNTEETLTRTIDASRLEYAYIRALTTLEPDLEAAALDKHVV